MDFAKLQGKCPNYTAMFTQLENLLKAVVNSQLEAAELHLDELQRLAPHPEDIEDPEVKEALKKIKNY